MKHALIILTAVFAADVLTDWLMDWQFSHQRVLTYPEAIYQEANRL